jgi:beta-mannosidase
MRRALRPVALALTNEGMNGVDLHVWNDRPERVEGMLHLRLMKNGAQVVYAATRPLVLEGRSSITLSVEAVLGRFVDVAHAYRFGAPAHDTVHAVWVRDTLSSEDDSLFEARSIIDEAVLLPLGDARPMSATGLRARVVSMSEAGDLIVALTTSTLAQLVRVGSAAHRTSDSYVTLVAGVERRVRLALIDADADPTITIEALNDSAAVRVRPTSATAGLEHEAMITS